MTATFEEWTGARTLPSFGTNSGAVPLAFQEWHHFKEAFAPELVLHAVRNSRGRISACLDPFGGSGTTALTAAFLGISSTTVEVNPFLADAIKAKVGSYDADELVRVLAQIRRAARSRRFDGTTFADVPPTFIEPGVAHRWLFDRRVADRIGALLASIDALAGDSHRRLFRVLVGGLLTNVSNATVSGKGRRYRRHWQDRRIEPHLVDELFATRARQAIADIHRFSRRPKVLTDVVVGDARSVDFRRTHDLAIFSPPYPNSFDYTDVYNIELWMLGYLNGSADNRALRTATLSSHVQLARDFPAAPIGSAVLDRTLARLEQVKERLWSPWIPDMVGGYFADLSVVLARVRTSVRDAGECWMVVGDSRYGGVSVPTATILTELAPRLGWLPRAAEPVRSMRSSAQHGGQFELSETLLVWKKAAKSDHAA